MHNTSGGRMIRLALNASPLNGAIGESEMLIPSSISCCMSSVSEHSSLSSSSSGSKDSRMAILRFICWDSCKRAAIPSSLSASTTLLPFLLLPFCVIFFPLLRLWMLEIAPLSSMSSSSSSSTFCLMAHEKHWTSETRSAVAKPPYSAARKSSRNSDWIVAMGRGRPRNGVLRMGRIWLHDAHLIVEPDHPSKGLWIVEFAALSCSAHALAMCWGSLVVGLLTVKFSSCMWAPLHWFWLSIWPDESSKLSSPLWSSCFFSSSISSVYWFIFE